MTFLKHRENIDVTFRLSYFSVLD